MTNLGNNVQIHLGECWELLKTLPDNSVEAIVTDPPYALTNRVIDDVRCPVCKWSGSGRLRVSAGASCPRCGEKVIRERMYRGKGFMQKTWDTGDVVFNPEFWKECLRVAKPGAYLLAMGGPRTFHRLACAIEDAGWELFDCIMWVFSTGFPKSLDLSKAIDKKLGKKREVVGSKVGLPGYSLKHSGKGGVLSGRADGSLDNSEVECQITAPASDEAKLWDGYGSAIKPAYETILCARKKVDKNYANNALKWGCGGLNIDRCRVPLGNDRLFSYPNGPGGCKSGKFHFVKRAETPAQGNPAGRWPANFIHDGSEQVLKLFPYTHGHGSSHHSGSDKGLFNWGAAPRAQTGGESGSAARFFYCAKASKKEKTCGGKVNNGHPTVKPLLLMKYLCRLVKQPGKTTVLDPFMGSGTTGVAAVVEGCGFIGMEMEESSFRTAEQRIRHFLPGKKMFFTKGGRK